MNSPPRPYTLALNDLVVELAEALRAEVSTGALAGQTQITSAASPNVSGSIRWRRGEAHYLLEARDGPAWTIVHSYSQTRAGFRERGAVARELHGIQPTGDAGIDFLIPPQDWRGVLSSIVENPEYGLPRYGPDATMRIVGQRGWMTFWTPSIIHLAHELQAIAAARLSDGSEWLVQAIDDEDLIAIRATNGRIRVSTGDSWGDPEVWLDRAAFVGGVDHVLQTMAEWIEHRGFPVTDNPNLSWLRSTNEGRPI